MNDGDLHQCQPSSRSGSSNPVKPFQDLTLGQAFDSMLSGVWEVSQSTNNPPNTGPDPAESHQ